MDNLKKSDIQVKTTLSCKNGINLTYALLCSVPEDGSSEQLFSILVILNEGEGGYETDLVFDVSRDPEYAEELLRLLWRNEVTPYALREVLSELL